MGPHCRRELANGMFAMGAGHLRDVRLRATAARAKASAERSIPYVKELSGDGIADA